MKKILILVFVFVSFTSFSQSNDEIEIRKVLASQNDAWNRGDVDTFMVGYWDNDSLMFIGSSGAWRKAKAWPRPCLCPAHWRAQVF
jgi:hypothetical protein